MTYHIKLNIDEPGFETSILGDFDVVVDYNQSFNSTLDSIKLALSTSYSFQGATVDKYNKMCITFSLPEGPIFYDTKSLYLLLKDFHDDIMDHLKRVFLPCVSLVFNVDVLY